MGLDDLKSRIKCVHHWYGNNNLTPPKTTVKNGQYLIFGGDVANAIFQDFGIFGAGIFSNATGEQVITSLYKSKTNLDLQLHVVGLGTSAEIYTEKLYVGLMIFIMN